MTKRMFAGAMGPAGFVNYFNQIMPLSKAKTRFILKGSSGSGKSSFIKKIASILEENDTNIDLFHCSNDVSSLDALAVDSQGILIVDGTAPHVFEPEVHSIVDKVINFGEFINANKIHNHKNKIEELIYSRDVINQKVMNYFSALGHVRAAQSHSIKPAELTDIAKEIVRTLDIPKSEGYGIDYKFFLSAVTPDGFKSLSKSYFEDCKVYGIYDGVGAGGQALLDMLRTEFHAFGINTKSFYSPFYINKMESLKLENLKVTFVLQHDKYSYNGNIDEKIILSNITNKDEEIFDILLNATVALMSQSKGLHNKIEEIYISAMDFARLNIATEQLMEEILNATKT